MRAEAQSRKLGDQVNEPQTTIIHWHHKEQTCFLGSGGDQKHETYAAVVGEEK